MNTCMWKLNILLKISLWNQFVYFIKVTFTFPFKDTPWSKMTCLARYLVQPLRGPCLTIRIQTWQSASSSEEKKCHCNQSPSEEFKYFLLIMMIFPFAALLLSHFLEMHDVYNEPSVDKGTSVCHTHSTPHRPPLRTLLRTAVYGVRQ